MIVRVGNGHYSMLFFNEFAASQTEKKKNLTD